MIHATRSCYISVLLVALTLGLTGCYTQLATVDYQSERTSTHDAVAESATTTQSDEYVDEAYYDARAVDSYSYRTDDIAYARQAYEARARGEISFAQYRDILVDLHYADPFQFYLHPSLFYDPLFSPMIPRARFSAAITFGTSFGYSPYRYGYGFSRPYMRSVYRPGMHFSIHHHYYSPGYYYHPRSPRYVFAHGGYYGYRPYYNISRPYAIQRGSTFGARSSTIATGRVGTQGRVISTGSSNVNGRVGTQGRVPATDTINNSTRRTVTAGDSNARQGTAGRTGSERSTVRARIPERLETPERRAPQARSTPRTTRSDRDARTTRDRGNTRTTRDRGNNNTRTRSNGNSGSTSSGSRGSSTRSDRGSGSSSRGSSSRRGGNN